MVDCVENGISHMVGLVWVRFGLSEQKCIQSFTYVSRVACASIGLPFLKSRR